jgi:hypothetical protein
LFFSFFKLATISEIPHTADYIDHLHVLCHQRQRHVLM